MQQPSKYAWKLFNSVQIELFLFTYILFLQKPSSRRKTNTSNSYSVPWNPIQSIHGLPLIRTGLKRLNVMNLLFKYLCVIEHKSQ